MKIETVILQRKFFDTKNPEEIKNIAIRYTKKAKNIKDVIVLKFKTTWHIKYYYEENDIL